MSKGAQLPICAKKLPTTVSDVQLHRWVRSSNRVTMSCMAKFRSEAAATLTLRTGRRRAREAYDCQYQQTTGRTLPARMVMYKGRYHSQRR